MEIMRVRLVVGGYNKIKKIIVGEHRLVFILMEISS